MAQTNVKVGLGPPLSKTCKAPYFQKHTLTYQIVVAYQISVALGTSLEINNHSLSNNCSLGKINNKKLAPNDSILVSHFDKLRIHLNIQLGF